MKAFEEALARTELWFEEINERKRLEEEEARRETESKNGC